MINDTVRDAAIAYAITNGTRLHLVSTDPGLTYATVTANDLGNAAVTLGAAEDGPVSGRQTECPQVVVTPSGTGTATHWAVTNNADEVISSGAMSPNLAVTSGVDVTINAFVAVRALDVA